MTFMMTLDDSEKEEVSAFKEDAGEKDDEENEEETNEDIGELEKIESKIEKGEEAAISLLDSAAIQKTHVLYQCPISKKIYWKNKWVKDNITDIYSIRTELAYSPKYLEKGLNLFIGLVEIFDKKLSERKKEFIELAKRVENELEDAMPFEIIINTAEKNGILFIFTNTTRLAVEIGKALRQEFQGGAQYEWFERNQYLRVKWYDMIDNRDYFKKKIRSLKNKRFGMFAFEEES